MSVKFKNPPINELVIGVYFDSEVPSLRSEHVGLFWGEVKKDFRSIHQQPPVTRPGMPAFFAVQVNPMPRFWLEASDGSTLMQIQRDAFLLNWRKKDKAYPHFDEVKASFDKNKKRFFKFISDELKEPEPKAKIAELTYINLIESCDYWKGPLDTSKVIPRFSLPVPESPDPPDFQQITESAARAGLNPRYDSALRPLDTRPEQASAHNRVSCDRAATGR